MIFNNREICLQKSEDVMPPSEWTKFFINNIQPNNYEKDYPILDLGTGSGVISITLGFLGYKFIHASDINPIAVDLAKINLSKNLTDCEINIYKSDLFMNIPETRKFSLIVFNPPSFERPQRGRIESFLEYSFFYGESADQFICDVINTAPEYLLPEGRMVFLAPSFHPIMRYITTAQKYFNTVKIINSKSILWSKYLTYIDEIGLPVEMITQTIFKNNKVINSDYFSLHMIEAQKNG